MPSKTLLELTQDILSTLDSDAVDSIGDTVEADQIAKIVRKTYYDIVDEYSLPFHREAITLDAVADVDRPNLLKIPSDVSKIVSWQYNIAGVNDTSIRYTEMHYVSPGAFINHVSMRDSSDTTSYKVVEYATDIKLIVAKTIPPMYWTSFDDEYIVVDNYDEAVDATLQASKTLALVEKRPHFELLDSFVPNLPENLQVLLHRTAEGEAYAILKQRVNPKLEQKEHRLRIRAQRDKHRATQSETNLLNNVPNYGRRR